MGAKVTTSGAGEVTSRRTRRARGTHGLERCGHSLGRARSDALDRLIASRFLPLDVERLLAERRGLPLGVMPAFDVAIVRPSADEALT